MSTYGEDVLTKRVDSEKSSSHVSNARRGAAGFASDRVVADAGRGEFVIASHALDGVIHRPLSVIA